MERTLPPLRRFDWLGIASLTLLVFLFAALMVNLWGTDARGYWSAFDGGLYDLGWQSREGAAFVYPPPVALLLWPFQFLPFQLFYALLTAASMAALCWLVGWRWAGFVAVFYFPALRDLLDGNIHILLAAALAASVWPAMFIKLTTGVVLLEPILSRRWREIGVALAWTAGVCLLSLVVLGWQTWVDWFALLDEATDKTTGQLGLLAIPLTVRLPIAIGLCIAAVRWRWLLAPGAMVALPALWWSSPALLLAIPRLRHAAAIP